MTATLNGARTGDRAPIAVQSFSTIPNVLEIPSLIQLQLDSFDWFRREGLRDLLDEISPIQDFTSSKMDLIFGEYEFREPKYDQNECRERDKTYAAPLFVDVELRIKDSGEIKEQRLFFGDFPLMTDRGTFIVNGAERVVVSQLVRSPGVYYTAETDPQSGQRLASAKLIPSRGAWLEFETSAKRILSVKIDRKRKLPVTVLIRVIDEPGLLPGDADDPAFAKYYAAEARLEREGSPAAQRARDTARRECEKVLGTDERVLAFFEGVDLAEDASYLQPTLGRREGGRTNDPCENKHDALLELYRKIRPGDPPTHENARALVNQLFFNPRRYDLGRVGRHKLNKRLGLDAGIEQRWLRPLDLVELARELINVNAGRSGTDDIDHLGNRRVRAVGELIQQQFRIGLVRMERVVRERMTITDPAEATPSALINIRPVVAAMKEFFGGSQLSQFMDQTNPLAELTHKRRLSALGPGGLSRDRAGFDVRDVHHSHYGRICPIETPEGPNIGLIGSLATYGRLNDFGFIETPYRRVVSELAPDDPALIGREVRATITGARETVIAEPGDVVDRRMAGRLKRLGERVPVNAVVSDEITYLTADEEERFVVGQANTRVDAGGRILDERVEVRVNEEFKLVPPHEIDYLDVSPKQMVSVAAALIPFLEHDDANRALMGSNMQRQAVPLVRPEAPLVGTGMEARTAVDSGHVAIALGDGEVIEASGARVVVRYDDDALNTDRQRKGRVIPLRKFQRSNQGTCLNQRPLVFRGERVREGQPLVDSSSTQGGELALGQNVLCAFMSWEGYNFEDAIIVSENLVREDKFTSIHIEKHEIEARDTKLGSEEITRDIPNVGEEALANLDEEGIIRIGAEVRDGDILVGKITPKGETELTAEEKLLRAIFGEKAREVRDTSLRLPHGERGKVIDVRVFDRETDPELPAGVNRLVRVSTAQRRKIAEGDKMAGRHGNKGVISRILPREDLPYLPDGTPVDIILNPIGVPSRMNIGQVLETHLGWAASALGFRASSPVFDGADDGDLEDALARAWMAAESGAVSHADGREYRFDPAVAADWLREQGHDPGPVLDEPEKGAAKRACLELWLKQAGRRVRKGTSIERLEAQTQEVFAETGAPPPLFGKTTLCDGRTGEPFDQPVTVGYIYMLKLSHLVEDKIHARSTGPYSLITQQPLGGKAQFGGQRFGEMEVWALEAYGAAHILQELLTVKSDDVVGRVKTYEAIVKGEDVLEPGVPESFKVLVKELQSLGLAIDVSNDEGAVSFSEDAVAEEMPRLGVNLSGFEAAEEEFFNARSE